MCVNGRFSKIQSHILIGYQNLLNLAVGFKLASIIFLLQLKLKVGFHGTLETHSRSATGWGYGAAAPPDFKDVL